MTIAADEVAAHIPGALAALTPPVTGYVLGQNVRVGRPQPATEATGVTDPVPHKCIFVQATRGIRDTPWKSDVVGEMGLSRPAVQITVRGDGEEYNATATLADAVWHALDKNPPTGYLESRGQGSGPEGPFEDESGHPTWTVNLLLIKQV